MIKRDSIDNLLSLAKIEEVVGNIITLTRKGQNYIACCPFHNERTPSFVVSPIRNIYKCFGCGKGGGVLSFIMEHENLSYLEALRYLAARYNFVLEEEEVNEFNSEVNSQQEQKRESLRVILEFAKQFFYTAGKQSSIMQNYWHQRGFNSEVIDEFQLGYADDRTDSLVKALQVGQYDLELARECGLIQLRANIYVDAYINRIIFPIWDTFGRVIAFAARVLGAGQPKYINSPEHELYVKSRTLYALPWARKAIIKMDNCYIVEGYTDAMRLHSKGIKNVVASAGTALGSEQIKLLKRQTKIQKITILYDADQAGLQNTMRAFALVIKEGLDVYAVKWANYEIKQDPDSTFQSYNQIEIEDFLQKNSMDFVDFRYQVCQNKHDLLHDVIKRHQLLEQILGDVAQFPDIYRTKKSLYKQKIAQLFGLSMQDLETTMISNIPNLDTRASSNWQVQKKKYSPNLKSINKIEPITHSEEDILRLLWQYPEEKWNDIYLRDYILQNYADEFSDPNCVSMLQIYQAEYKQKQVVPSENLFLGHENLDIRKLMERLLERIALRELGVQEQFGGGNPELLAKYIAEKKHEDIQETLDLHIIRILRKAEKDNILESMHCSSEKREELIIKRKVIINQIEQIKARISTTITE